MNCLELSIKRPHHKEDRLRPKVLVSVSHWPGQNQSTPLLKVCPERDSDVHPSPGTQSHSEIPH